MDDKNLKIVNEILNDAFWLGYILEIKRKLKDYNKKEILSSFLIFFSSIFVEEIIKADYGGLSGKRKVTLKEIEELRNYNLKYSPTTKSSRTNEVIKEMGIDFEHYVFDIVLILNNNNLLDINFRNWKFNEDSKFELLDGVVATPLRWIEIIMPEIYKEVKKMLQTICKSHIYKINDCNIYKKSYATYKLFNNDINKDDKLYILQRYGLIKTIMFIENMFEENISFDIGKFYFDFKNYIIKYITYNFGLFYKISLALAKLEYCSRT